MKSEHARSGRFLSMNICNEFFFSCCNIKQLCLAVENLIGVYIKSI